MPAAASSGRVGNIAEQINEINDEHTNKRYFKDIVLDEKIKAHHNLEEALKDSLDRKSVV